MKLKRVSCFKSRTPYIHKKINVASCRCFNRSRVSNRPTSREVYGICSNRSRGLVLEVLRYIQLDAVCYRWRSRLRDLEFLDTASSTDWGWAWRRPGQSAMKHQIQRDKSTCGDYYSVICHTDVFRAHRVLAYCTATSPIPSDMSHIDWRSSSVLLLLLSQSSFTSRLLTCFYMSVCLCACLLVCLDTGTVL